MSGSDGLDGIVWAQNTDGLGERLRAVLNGIALADRLGMPFRLSWEILRDSIAGDHSILPAREFFSEEFCDLYLEERDALEGRSTLLLEEFSDEQDAARSEPFNIIVTQTHLQTQARPIFAGTSVAPILEEAFAKISFSDKIEAAREAAYSADLPPDMTALHLRAGDVVYNIYRMTDQFHGKVTPYPLAIEICDRLCGEGKTPLLFGQDEALMEYLAEHHGARLASEFVPSNGEYSPAEKAMFDIFLMSRCNRILAGTSGFAILSSWLGQCKIDNPRSFFPPEEAVNLIDRHVFSGSEDERISKEQRAFACRSAFLFAKEKLASEEPFWRLLKKGFTLDPANDHLALTLACSYFAAGDVESADDILGPRLRDPHAIKSRLVLILRRLGKSNAGDGNSAYVKALEAGSEKGSRLAKVCLQISQGEKASELLKRIA